MTGSIDALKLLFLRYYHPAKMVSGNDAPDVGAEYLNRNLCCSPFRGNYDRVAGWTICMNGSPPKGRLHFTVDGPKLEIEADGVFFISLGGGAKQVKKEADLKIIRSFYEENLNGKTEGDQYA